MKKILFFLALPIIAIASEVPLFTVPVENCKIKVDGNLNDNEWLDAVKLTNFMRIGDNRFASEQTCVMVKASKENLYFAFKLDEYALDTFSNQYKTFKAKLKGKNQNQMKEYLQGRVDSIVNKYIDDYKRTIS